MGNLSLQGERVIYMSNDFNYSIVYELMLNYFMGRSRKMVCKNKVKKRGHQKWF